MDSNASVKQRFGEWLKAQREATRYSQGGAAQRAGIDRQQWYRIENGLSGTKRDTVIAIANALSLPVDEALTRAGFAPNVDSDDGLFSGIERFSAEDQARIRRQIKALIDSYDAELEKKHE